VNGYVGFLCSSGYDRPGELPASCPTAHLSLRRSTADVGSEAQAQEIPVMEKHYEDNEVAGRGEGEAIGGDEDADVLILF
jgi:hypothetical protein